MQDNNDYRYRIRRYSLDSKKCDLVKELEVGGLGFESNGRLAYYTLSQQFLMDTDPMDITVTSVIENMTDNKILFSVTDEFIGHFDDEFIYTSTIKEKHVEYKIYDWNGDLKQTIGPSASISDDYVCHDSWVNQDFSQIVNVINGNIIAYSTTPYAYVSCEVESGKCKVLQ